MPLLLVFYLMLSSSIFLNCLAMATWPLARNGACQHRKWKTSKTCIPNLFISQMKRSESSSSSYVVGNLIRVIRRERERLKTEIEKEREREERACDLEKNYAGAVAPASTLTGLPLRWGKLMERNQEESRATWTFPPASLSSLSSSLFSLSLCSTRCSSSFLVWLFEPKNPFNISFFQCDCLPAENWKSSVRLPHF